MKALMLLLFPVSCLAQGLFTEQGRMYSLKMHVLEVTEFTRSCARDTTVIWGTNFGDTTCFMFNGKIRCFFPVGRKIWDRSHKKKQMMRADRSDANICIRQDRLNEMYEIKFATGKTGVVIFITNVDFGMPNYVLSWSLDGWHGCTLCGH